MNGECGYTIKNNAALDVVPLRSTTPVTFSVGFIGSIL
jgi:hypothetical protein